MEKIYSPTGTGDDTVLNTSGADVLAGGGGADVYTSDRGTGADTIDNRGHGGDGDYVVFGSGVAVDQLWFDRLGNDLQVSIIGTSDSTTVVDWYLETANHVSAFLTGGKQLAHSQVDNLVSAMAAFSPPTVGQTDLTTEQHQQLDTLIAANWKNY